MEQSIRDTVLVVEDEATLPETLEYNLTRQGYRVVTASDGVTALERARHEKPQVILMDELASALDSVAAPKIEKVIQTLKQEYTITIVTHNMQQAGRASDHTTFFNIAED